MYCKICGSEEGAKWRHKQRNRLCVPCLKTTPAKIPWESFDKRYWGKNFRDVPLSTRREFYADYKASSNTFLEYKATTSYER
jgi:hypothetical protein